MSEMSQHICYAFLLVLFCLFGVYDIHQTTLIISVIILGIHTLCVSVYKVNQAAVIFVFFSSVKWDSIDNIVVM